MKGQRDKVVSVFCTPRMKEIYSRVTELSGLDEPVLIHGERGVGKETVARSIHQASTGARPFIKVTCRPRAPESQETELFGRAGSPIADTGSDVPGKIQFAKGGTLYLEGLCDLAMVVQERLIATLSHRTVSRHGCVDSIFRVMASTGDSLIGADRQHPHWYQRLNTVDISIPPLRERKEEIRALSEYFMLRVCRRYDHPVQAMPEGLIQLFEAHEWRVGNLEELDEAVKKYVLERAGGRSLDDSSWYLRLLGDSPAA